tara:strand:+ start:123 stop:1331 length:1209 start_codon:yes stop_codon:yes gene_type:complete
MALNKNNTKFFETGSISFSDIKNTFGGSGEIRASQYLRQLSEANLDDDATTPTIPDSTENSNISDTRSNWNVESFRGSNKEIVITQSGQEADIILDENSDIWDGNLDKNIPKRLVINGTVFSTSNTSPALSLTGNMQNLDVEVSTSGAIYGEGGLGNQNGGDALYIRNLRSTSPVDLFSYGKIWSGGGGGRGGNSGNSGSRLNCTETYFFDINNNATNKPADYVRRVLWDSAPGKSCRKESGGSQTYPHQGANAIWYNATPTSTRARCRGGANGRQSQGIARWSAWRKTGNYECSPNWRITCIDERNFNKSGGSGGSGGSAGTGKGFSRSQNNGGSGSRGNCRSCPGSDPGTSCGSDGNPGNPGGDWGSAGDGTSAGAAISKRNVRIQYSTSTTLKGREINN